MAGNVLTVAAGGPQGILRNYWKQQLLGILENELMASDLHKTPIGEN